MKKILLVLLVLTVSISLFAEDGYRLWLRYDELPVNPITNGYRSFLKGWIVEGNSPTINAAASELKNGLGGLLGADVKNVNSISSDGIVIAAKFKSSKLLSGLNLAEKLKPAGDDGYLISTQAVNGKNVIIITANEDIGVLYGVFSFLRMLQTNEHINYLDIVSAPKIKLRLLNHWDNLDRFVERGYAGISIWDWHRLPWYIDPRYTDYARANASVGINGTVLTNVNANAFVLTPQYLEKVKAIADVLRPYGIKVYLTARFSAPVEIGKLKTADPLDKDVQQWWKDKVKEIYSYIPDFGGFLVKANSEGQPGPQNYGRTHTDGANMLADALKPYNGIVMWRAFVYDNIPEDRAKLAYKEFKPLDGTFRDNVLIQVKNGPLDFQPREPFHPLFGAMPATPLMMEFQITQEYLGNATHLVYLGTLYKECLDADTYAKGEGSQVAKVIDGSLEGHELTGIAGVSNIGNERNWTGHLFGQANWYVFGRLAWDINLNADQVADEWIRMTFTNDNEVVSSIKEMMMESRENTVNYMTPIGLHHIMGWDKHYGPGPWVKDKSRADWTAVYYHQADSAGIGFDRTASGSNALGQYYKPVDDFFSSLETCPDEYLLWFHHLSWDYKMKSGKTLWDEICYHYNSGVEGVIKMQSTWNSLREKIDNEEFNHVSMLLNIQLNEARWWRNSCLLYFQSFSKRPFPADIEQPEGSLEYYESMQFPYAPGI